MQEMCITCKYYKNIKNKPLPKCMFNPPVNVTINDRVISMLPDIHDNDFCSNWCKSTDVNEIAEIETPELIADR